MQENSKIEAVKFDLKGTKKKHPARITGTVYNQFADKGIWLRANLHCHLSRVGEDAEWPANALQHYAERGYDVVGGMCHDKIIAPEPYENIVVIPGAEISCGGHLLALGIEEIPENTIEGERLDKIAAMIRKLNKAGGITVLAHPFKSAYTWKELNAFCDAGLDGFEVVNSNVRGKLSDSGRADQLWHNLLREGWSLVALGNDDAHGPHEKVVANGWGGIPHIAFTGILAEERSPAAVLEAIRRGRTYASEAPEIRSMTVREDGKMSVQCSPCVACHFRSVGGGWGGSSCYSPEGQPGSEEFTFDFAHSGYRIQERMTIVLQDVYGRRAWSSPIRADIGVETLEQAETESQR